MAALAACSRNPPPMRDVRVIDTREANPELAANKAHAECQEQARKTRIRSIVGMFRPSRAERKYNECMRERGFEPRAGGNPAAPPPDLPPSS